MGIAGRQCRIGHFGRCGATWLGHAIGLTQQGVGIEQAVPAYGTLGRRMAVQAGQAVHHPPFTRGAGGQRHVPTLALQRDPAPATV